MRGNGNTSGIALVEVYDINQAVASRNSPSYYQPRAMVGTGDSIVIAGFIVGNKTWQRPDYRRGSGRAGQPWRA